MGGSELSIRILLVDDHQLFRSGLRALFEKHPDLELVAEVADGRSGVRASREAKPDVVLMDLSMPEMNGVDATRQLCTEWPAARVLCLSMHSEEKFVQAALCSGATGYLLKDCALEELVYAIRSTAAGRVYLSPGIAGWVVEGFRANRGSEDGSAFSLLTEREREVLQLIAEGHSTRKIAACLCLSVKTIATHREHLMKKLDIRSVAGLTKYAIREGLTSNAG